VCQLTKATLQKRGGCFSILEYRTVPCMCITRVVVFIRILSGDRRLALAPGVTYGTSTVPIGALHRGGHLSYFALEQQLFEFVQQGILPTGLYQEYSMIPPLAGPLPEFLPDKFTEVKGISFVGSTSEVYCPHPLCNLQNLCPIPPESIRPKEGILWRRLTSRPWLRW